MYATEMNARAFLMAMDLFSTVANSLRPEEHMDVFRAFFDICKAGLSSHQFPGDQGERRLRPFSDQAGHI